MQLNAKIYERSSPTIVDLESCMTNGCLASDISRTGFTGSEMSVEFVFCLFF